MSEIVKAYRFNYEKGYWEQLIQYKGKDGEMVSEWCGCGITDVPVEDLIGEWESLVAELSNNEEDLSSKKEEYANKEFEIVFMSDIDFKSLYGSTSEKVRKQHAKTELSELDGEIKALELSIGWIRSYIPLLKEVIRTKQ